MKTDVEIELERLLKLATPGPWWVETDQPDVVYGYVHQIIKFRADDITRSAILAGRDLHVRQPQPDRAWRQSIFCGLATR